MAVSIASSTLSTPEPGGTTRGRVVHAFIGASVLLNDLTDVYLWLLYTVVFSKFMHCLLGVYLYVHATRDSRFRLWLTCGSLQSLDVNCHYGQLGVLHLASVRLRLPPWTKGVQVAFGVCSSDFVKPCTTAV